jgi:hypothetical protein
MLPARHITHRALLRCGNVMAGLAVCVACLIGSPASAADIDAATAKQAFAVAANWVARGQAPRETFALPATGVSAVHVTLRHQGLTLGQATATAPTPLRPADQTDVLDLMKRAVVKALTESQKALTALASRADRRTVPSTLAAIAPELQFDVQFAGVPQAVRLERFIDLPKAFVLDHHGLVLEREDKLAWAFPATSLAANVSLAGQIDRLMGQLDIPLLDRPTIGSPEGPALYRFDALHMVSRGRGKPATVLHRGNVLLPAKPFDAEASATHATQWADHLLRVQREDGHFAGTFEPTAGRFASPTATPADAALAAYALARWSRMPGLPTDRAARLAAAAREALVAITTDLLGSQFTTGAAANVAGQPRNAAEGDRPALMAADCAMAVIALVETPGASDLKAQRDRLAGALLAMQKPDGAFRRVEMGDERPASRPVQALGAAAMARMYAATRDPQYLTHAQAAIAATWRNLPAGRMPTALPWLAEAEFTLARLDRATPGILQLHKALAELWSLQVTAENAPADRVDTVGGFRLDEGLIPEPTAQSARLLAAHAAALRVENFIAPDQQTKWIVGVGLGLRFCGQLTMTPESAFYCPAPEHAIGGVRDALWDNRQPLDATAMALLAAAELQHSLTSLAK